MSTICNRCRQNEAREGMKSCEPCGVKAAANMQRVRVNGGADYKKKQAVWKCESFTRRRPLLVASGICLHCQCKPVEPGLKTCRECLNASSPMNPFAFYRRPVPAVDGAFTFYKYRRGGYNSADGTYGRCFSKEEALTIIKRHWEGNGGRAAE